MANYVVGTLVEHSVTGSANTEINAPNFTATAGDLLICVVMLYGLAVTISISDTAGSNDTWTRVESGYSDGTHQLEMFYLENCAAGSCTVRASWSGGRTFPAICVVPVSGIATSSALLDGVFNFQSSPGAGTDAVTSTNLGTLATQPAMLFGLTFDVVGVVESTPILGTGFTNIGSGWNYGSFDIAMRAEHKRVTVTTADDATFTAGGPTHAHVTTAAAFKEFVTLSVGIPPIHMARYVTGEMRQ